MAENVVKKPRAHKLTAKFPVIVALLLALIAFYVMQFIAVPFTLLCRSVFPWHPQDTSLIGTLFSTGLILFLYKLFFKPEYEGSLKGGSISEGFLLCLAHVAYLVLSSLANMIANSFAIGVPSLQQISASVMAGFLEETAFRALLIATLMRQWRNDEKKFIPAALISAIVFGSTHAFNLFAGANPLQTLCQVFSAGCGGFFFAAVFLRTGNILPTMVMHAIQDIASAAVFPTLSEGMILQGTLGWADYVDLGLGALLCAFGVFLLRPAKRGRISEVWNKKWSNELPAV